MPTTKYTNVVEALLLGIVVGISFSIIVASLHGETDPSTHSGIILSFSIPGQLSFIEPEGSTVVAGDIIARLDATALTEAHDQAEAAVTIEQAKVAELAAVDTEQKILTQKAQEEAAVEARVTLEHDEKTLATALISEASSTQAVVASTDPLFTDPETSSPQLLVPTDALSAAAVESGQIAAFADVSDVAALGLKASAASSSPVQLSALAQSATADVAEIQLFLESLAFLEKQASTSPALSVTTLVGWQNDVAGAQDGINTVIHTLLATEDAVNYDQSGAVPASVPPVVLDSQLAARETAEAEALSQAQAEASSTTIALSAAVLQAPAAGKISTTYSLKIGQSIAAGQPVISLTPNP